MADETFQKLLSVYSNSIVDKILKKMCQNRYKVDVGDINIPKGPILYRWLVSGSVIQDDFFPIIIKNKIKQYNADVTKGQAYDISKDKLENIFCDDISKKDNINIQGKTYYALYFGKSIHGRERIIKQHVKGCVDNSTLRRTICGLFVESPNDKDRELKIDEILANSYFEYLPLNESTTGYIDCLESICIAFGHYPLNIEGNHFFDKQWLLFSKALRKNVKVSKK